MTGLLTYASLGVPGASAQATPQTNGQNFHMFPSVPARDSGALPPDAGPLLYNGGPVMQAGVTPFVIFWIPPTLQNGGATSLTAHYQTIQKNMLGDYNGHALGNNNTQYYQIVGTKTTYIQNKGAAAATSFVDTNPYPTSGCSDTVTPGNCITDAQLQAEIQRVMTLKGWTGGLNKMYFVYTSTGEGSCFDGTSSACAYTAYCAYHGFINASTPVVYANMPYADPNFCYSPGSGQTSPNADIPADAAANVTSHELTEAITDPELNAWFSAQGNEIGDLCAWTFGTLTWDSSLANQMWNGHFYNLQQEFDNHAPAGKKCVQLGP